MVVAPLVVNSVVLFPLSFSCLCVGRGIQACEHHLYMNYLKVIFYIVFRIVLVLKNPHRSFPEEGRQSEGEG